MQQTAELGTAQASSWGHRSSLTLGALGIVFGDIGTSPLYALKECFHASHGIPIDTPNVLGHPLADFLGADHRGVAQIHRLYHARR